MPDPNLPMLRGDRWRASHKASVVSILGADAPPVYSTGSRFYNVDRWTVRVLTKLMCDWAKANPGCMPTKDDVQEWVSAANAEKTPAGGRRIVIAATPENLSLRVALALGGGCYHEALHTWTSARRSLSVKEVAEIVLPRWAKVADWSKLYGLLQEWSNLVEDIRIERRGCEVFPGIYSKMCELQDFILAQEETDRLKVLAALGPEPTEKPLPIVSAMFRDVGLGYNTNDQERALRGYHERNPEACDIVESGPLRAIVDEAIDLGRHDDTGCLRLAMDALVELSKLVDPEDMEKSSEQAAGCGGKPKCPKCGAPGKDLVVRPLSNGSGGKIKGKGIITCTKCGWQEIVDLKVSSGPAAPAPPSDPDDCIRYEDVPQDPGESGDSSGEGESGEGAGKPTPEGKGGGEKKEEADGGTSDNKPGEDGTSGNDGEGDGTSEEGEGEPEEGGGANPGEDEGPGDSDTGGAASSGTTSGDEDSDGVPMSGAGGHFWNPERAKAWEMVAEEVLEAAAAGEGTGLRDANSALEEAVGNAKSREDADCAKDERPWRPWDLDSDVIQVVAPSDQGMGSDKTRSRVLLGSVKSECAFLRARLRSIVRSVEQRAITHGVPKGKGLSERMLTNTVAHLRAGQKPRRAYYTVADKIDTSLAAVVIIDQSGSMGWPRTKLQDATRCLMAITEPLDSLGSKVLVAGFRDGPACRTPANYAEVSAAGCHRYQGVCHDIFKSFDERFTNVRWRFANTRAEGGTPMADGVQFGLDCLSLRQEAHRVLFIVTDGQPNGGHEAVIRRQVRLAKKASIHVVGVGIGEDSREVMTLFPDHVWAPSIKELPKGIIAKLNELLDFRGLGRGTPLRQTA